MWDGVSHPSRWIPQSGNRIERRGKCQQLSAVNAAEDAECSREWPTGDKEVRRSPDSPLTALAR